MESPAMSLVDGGDNEASGDGSLKETPMLGLDVGNLVEAGVPQ